MFVFKDLILNVLSTHYYSTNDKTYVLPQRLEISSLIFAALS